MTFVFDGQFSDSPLVEAIWRTRSSEAGMFTSLASTNWEMVITRYQDKTTLTVRGPETIATPAPIPPDAEFFGITFKLGTFMPHLPNSKLVNNPINLPDASDTSVWLHGAAWQIPDYDHADQFVHRLVRQGLLVQDRVVSAALQNELPNQQHQLSQRSIQRRFLRTTGLTYSTIRQIERARRAAALLTQGIPILDTTFELGYADQPHLTRSLKRFIGYTPSHLIANTALLSYLG